MTLRRDLWRGLAFVAFVGLVGGSALAYFISRPALPYVALVGVGLWITCVLVAWRCDAGLRDEQRHRELLQALQGASRREPGVIKPLKERFTIEVNDDHTW